MNCFFAFRRCRRRRRLNSNIRVPRSNAKCFETIFGHHSVKVPSICGMDHLSRHCSINCIIRIICEKFSSTVVVVKR